MSFAYIATSNVKGAQVSSAESLANFCLAPMRYFGKGRTVELFKHDDEHAVYVFSSYKKDEKSWVKTAFMIIAFVPGFLIGIMIKAPIVLWQNSRDESAEKNVTAICKADIKLIIDNWKNTTLVSGNLSLKGSIDDVRKALAKINPYVKYETLVLSDITSIRLPVKHSKLNEQGYIELPSKVLQRWEVRKESIFKNIHFFNNLKRLDLGDRFPVTFTDETKKVLRQINPLITTLRIPDFNRNLFEKHEIRPISKRARDWF